MSDQVHIPLTRQWRVTVDDGVPHLEIELDGEWSRAFVAEKFPSSFAAEPDPRLVQDDWGYEE